MKKILSVLLVLLIIILISACSSKPEKPAVEHTQEVPSEKSDITDTSSVDQSEPEQIEKPPAPIEEAEPEPVKEIQPEQGNTQDAISVSLFDMTVEVGATVIYDTTQIAEINSYFDNLQQADMPEVSPPVGGYMLIIKLVDGRTFELYSADNQRTHVFGSSLNKDWYYVDSNAFDSTIGIYAESGGNLYVHMIE